MGYQVNVNAPASTRSMNSGTSPACGTPSCAAIFGPLRHAGFFIDTVDEPQPEPGCGAGSPDGLQFVQTKPIFLFIRAIRDHAAAPGRTD